MLFPYPSYINPNLIRTCYPQMKLRIRMRFLYPSQIKPHLIRICYPQIKLRIRLRFPYPYIKPHLQLLSADKAAVSVPIIYQTSLNPHLLSADKAADKDTVSIPIIYQTSLNPHLVSADKDVTAIPVTYKMLLYDIVYIFRTT